MTKKIFALIIMMTAFSFFVSCNAGGDAEEKKDITWKERAGDYTGSYTDTGTDFNVTATINANGTGKTIVTWTTDGGGTEIVNFTIVTASDMDSTKATVTFTDDVNADTYEATVISNTQISFKIDDTITVVMTKQ